MDASLTVMTGLVVVLAGLALATRGWDGVWNGLVQAGKMLQGLWFRLLLGLAMAGLIQVVVPSQVIARWMGEGSGLPGVLAVRLVIPSRWLVAFPVSHCR